MATNGKMLKAQAFILGERIRGELRRIAVELGRSLLTADLGVDVAVCETNLLNQLEDLAGCPRGELWDDKGVPNLVYAGQLADKGELKPYKGVTVTRGRRRKQAPEGGVS